MQGSRPSPGKVSANGPSIPLYEMAVAAPGAAGANGSGWARGGRRGVFAHHGGGG